MRHNKSGRRLGRNSSHRAAMMRNLVTSLIDHERITTTDARAKEVRKVAEKMILQRNQSAQGNRCIAMRSHDYPWQTRRSACPSSGSQCDS